MHNLNESFGFETELLGEADVSSDLSLRLENHMHRLEKWEEFTHLPSNDRIKRLGLDKLTLEGEDFAEICQKIKITAPSSDKEMPTSHDEKIDYLVTELWNQFCDSLRCEAVSLCGHLKELVERENPSYANAQLLCGLWNLFTDLRNSDTQLSLLGYDKKTAENLEDATWQALGVEPYESYQRKWGGPTPADYLYKAVLDHFLKKITDIATTTAQTEIARLKLPSESQSELQSLLFKKIYM